MKEVSVFVTGVEPMADMAVDLLRTEGIPVRKSVNYRELCSYPLDGLGEVEVIVPISFAQKALEILSVRFSEVEEETGDGNDSENEDDEEDSKSR